MAKTKAPSTADILRLGPEAAALKASMPPKRWKNFVKQTHKRGNTIGGALSSAPDSLKERTASSLKAEAQRTIGEAYAPAEKTLSTREKALGYLDEKRKSDDANYRLWLSGEVGKINAQATAADTALATQQKTIADETATAIAASRADSLARVAAANGNVSDPTQSTALDTSAADAASTARVGAAREHTANIIKIGDDARTLSTAAIQGQQAARESEGATAVRKSYAELHADRMKLDVAKAGDTADKITSLMERNMANVAGTREADLAAGSLNLKREDAAQAIKDADRKYRLETRKTSLAEWKAKNADEVDRAKVKLGYDGIASREGQKAADRALDRELAKRRSRDKALDRDAKGGKDKPKVTQGERDLYRRVTNAKSYLDRWHANGAVLPEQMRQRLKTDFDIDDTTIDIAEDLRQNKGVLSQSARVKARKLGIVHSGYFWPPLGPTTPAGTGHA
jgi:hypothetical protein